LNDFLRWGYTQQNKLFYGVPFLVVDKKDNKLRLCINYCALNKITIKNNYLLPCIDDLLNRFNGVQYFNQIDFKLRCYQIHFVEEDVEKMTMRTKYGSYEFMIIYIDDILLYSKITEEHVKHLEYVLSKLQ
jgi:hypothetical protein